VSHQSSHVRGGLHCGWSACRARGRVGICILVSLSHMHVLLQTVCRSCLVKYLEENNTCPTCRIVIHQSHPLQYIGHDRTMQDIVYKLVPGLQEGECQNVSLGPQSLQHGIWGGLSSRGPGPGRRPPLRQQHHPSRRCAELTSTVGPASPTVSVSPPLRSGGTC